ncbi:hypothetical protein D3C73_1344090 [compost metagenome]
MANHVHLQNCFFHIHRLQIKALGADQFQIVVNVFHRSYVAVTGRILNEQRLQTALLAELTVNLRFVLANLAFELVRNRIHRCIHIIAAILCTKHNAAGKWYRYLNHVQAAHDT